MITPAAQRLRTVAVILAGGIGVRLGFDVPKQLLKVAGKPVIEHTVAAFQEARDVDEILVLMTPDHVAVVTELLISGRYPKVSAVLAGGPTRAETTQLALAAIGDEECNVLFHDAVRPLVSQRIIRECVNALRRYEAVDVAIASSDTIISVANDRIVDVPNRASLRRGQTPQGFRLSTIRRAYRLANLDPGYVATDDCTAVLRYLPEIEIHVVEGAEANLKITLPVDLFIADRLFQLNSAGVDPLADPEAYREHFRGRVVVVFGGNSGIGSDIVQQLKEHGATVFSFSRTESGTHVERPDDVAAALDKAYAETDRIDAVVVAAGVLHTGLLADTDAETVDETVGINLAGPIHVARLAYPYLAATHGHLLFFTSSSYTRGRAGYSLYSASKAAVVNLTQALSDEWATSGVRVNCVNPERTATPMRTRAFGHEPEHELLAPQDVARSSIDVLTTEMTGHVVDIRRTPSALVASRPPALSPL
jgi:2-C-methyl-D-erythritol 4-phosphate cytidylyltransferase